MTTPAPDPANIQANILRGSGTWQWACYVFLRIKNSRTATLLVEGLFATGHVGTAASVAGGAPAVNINIAFNHDGLDRISMPLSDALRFKRSFLMRPPHHEQSDLLADHGLPGSAFEGGMRSAILGDSWPGREDDGYEWPGGGPANAWWADDTEPKPWKGVDAWPHMLVWISASSHCARQEALGEIRALVAGIDGANEIGCQFAHALGENKEHFGFFDGVSQPAIEGFRPGNPGDGKLSARGWQSLPVGEFILGYTDEGYGPPERLNLAPVAKDGTFLVYRKLRQDVKAFRDASEQMAGASDLSSDEIEARVMGRHHDGTPLVVPPGSPDPPNDRSLWNDFTYANDPDGSRCPFGSHVRRANPRDDLHFEGRRVNRHRIIRRGMTYGDPYDPDVEDDNEDRGLIFIAFNARIEDQFEFIQKQWLNGGRTFRLGDDADPIAGNGENIRIVVNGEHPVLHCQPKPFTQFLGGDYFFVPSVTMLNEIASGN